MDSVQLIKYSLLSKVLNDGTMTQIFSSSLYFFAFAFIYILYQIAIPLIPQNIHENWAEIAKDYIKCIFPIYDKDESSINIPTHKKIYYTHTGGNKSESVKTIFSLRFRALNYYLQDKKYEEISSLVEIIKIENDKWGHDLESDYILFPLNNSRIQIDATNHIWFEVIVSTEKPDENEDKNKKLNFSKIPDRNYIFKLTTPGKKNIKILNQFVEDAVKEYSTHVLNKKDNIIIEYIRSNKDEDEKIKLIFKEYPFKSNKFLDKNIFFPEKEELIQYINQFSRHNTNNNSYLEYETAGLTHKATILLYGQPGTGKSCTIRGILNHTGRIGVLVQWSKIKTCSEFTALLRDLNINGKQYTLGELCFIFEDFGANSNRVLKSRKKIDADVLDINTYTIVQDYSKTIMDTDQPNQTTQLDQDIDKISNQDLKYSIQRQIEKYKSQIKTYVNTLQCISKPADDELTLDCILNTIDGINELHDAMIIFTDNHIDELDPAFLRAGRMNYKLELKLATVKVIQDMVKNKFELTEEEMMFFIDKYSEQFAQMKDYNISPADVQNICFKYQKCDIVYCLDEILDKSK